MTSFTLTTATPNDNETVTSTIEQRSNGVPTLKIQQVGQVTKVDLIERIWFDAQDTIILECQNSGWNEFQGCDETLLETISQNFIISPAPYSFTTV